MCKAIDKQIAADGKAISSAILSISTALSTTSPEIAATLAEAASTLVAATSNFKTGDLTDDINTAATAIESILSVIPVTAPYASFVAIAVAALDVLIANLGTQTDQSGDELPDAVKVMRHIDTLPENHWRGLIRIKRWPGEGPRTALVRKWNDQVDKQPQLNFSRL
jgi:hypothetical protein